MKARIIIFDDLTIIDETELEIKEREQIKNIAVNLVRTTPDALAAEVWVGKRLEMKFTKTRKGGIKSVTNLKNPNWGGKRRGSGRPSLGDKACTNRIVTYVNEEMFDYVENLNNKCAWIRQAIQEKMERESNNTE